MGPYGKKKLQKSLIRQVNWSKRYFPIGTLIKYSAYSIWEKKTRTIIGLVVRYDQPDAGKEVKLVVFTPNRFIKISPGSSVLSLQKPFNKSEFV